MEKDLDRAYDCNVIYPSYRNLIAVSSVADYLFSGSCQTLEGHEGAYYKYDMEARLDKIITQLDKVISQLESIKNNQNRLYNVAKDSKNAIERLERSMEETKKEFASLAEQSSITNSQLEKLTYNTALIEFNTDQTRRQVELRNRVDGILPRVW